MQRVNLQRKQNLQQRALFGAFRILILFLLALLLSCTYQPYRSGSVPSVVSANTAVMKLFDGASEDLLNENYPQAEAKLERALRIEPQNSELWFTLAQSARLQGQIDEAKNLANRALSYSGSNTTLHTKINEFISLL